MNRQSTLLSETEIKSILNMAVSATVTMATNGTDFEIIKARLQLLRELQDGFDIDGLSIPSNKKVLFKRFKDEIFGGELL